jgi:transposase-like protein
MRRRYTREQRSELIDLVTEGRATVPEAAARLEVPHSTAYKWLRKTTARPARAGKAARAARSAGRQAATATSAFVQLVRAGEARQTITVQIGGAAIEVRHGFDAEVLRSVVEALRGGVA